MTDFEVYWDGNQWVYEEDEFSAWKEAQDEDDRYRPFSFDTHRASDTYLLGRRGKVNHWCADVKEGV